MFKSEMYKVKLAFHILANVMPKIFQPLRGYEGSFLKIFNSESNFCVACEKCKAVLLIVDGRKVKSFTTFSVTRNFGTQKFDIEYNCHRCGHRLTNGGLIEYVQGRIGLWQ